MGAMRSLLRRFRAVLGQCDEPATLDGAVRIRRMRHGDLSAVAAIEGATFRGPWHASAFSRALADPHHNFFVAEVDGSLVGYGGLWVEGRQAHIAKLAVREGYRRRGVGTTLLAHLLDHARRLGLEQAYLEVRRSNLAAQQLYRRMGFRFERVQARAYPDDGEDALVFVASGLLELPLHSNP